MPVHKVQLVPGGVRVYTDPNTFFEGRASDFPGNAAAKAAALKVALQDWLDDIQLIADLPDDDPEKVADPATTRRFWRGLEIVSHEVEVTDVTITGAGPSTQVNISLRRVT